MTNNRHRERKAFTINTPIPFSVPISGLIFAITVILRGSLVISAGTTSGTSLGENPGNFLQRIKLLGASKGVYPNGNLRNLMPRSLIRRRILDKGWTFLDAALTGAAGTFTLNQPFRLPFAWPRLLPAPWATALLSDAYNSLQLSVETGSRDTQFSGNDRTFDFSAVTLDYMDHRENWPGALPNPTFEDDFPLIINAASTAGVFSDLPGGANYHDIFIVAETTNQVPADTIVNRLGVDLNGVQSFDFFQEELKEVQRGFIGDSDTDPSLGNGPLKGCYYLPLNPTGNVASAIPVPATRALRLLTDLNNPGGAGIDRLIVSNRRLLAAPAATQ